MVEKRFEKLGMPDIERFENYLPTAFNSELTLLQKVNKIIFDLIETNKLTNEMVDYLNHFIETFDEKLYETLEDVLNVWLEDGRLADIVRVAISEEVIEARTDYLGKKYVNLKERLDTERKEVIEAITDYLGKKYVNLKERLDTERKEVIEARTDYLGKKYVNLKERLDTERKEVIDSRGREADLKTRLDKEHQELTAQLAQSAKYYSRFEYPHEFKIPEEFKVDLFKNGGKYNTNFDIKTKKIQNGGRTYYVSPDGSDVNDGLTPTTPLQSIQTAINKTDVETIFLSEGDYFSDGVTLNVNKSVNIIGIGKVRLINGYKVTWTPQGTYSNVYQTSSPTWVGGIVLLDTFDVNGDELELIKKTSLALDVAETPYSFAVGTSTYINLPYSPTNDNIAILTSGIANGSIFVTDSVNKAQVKLYLENVTVLGGGTCIQLTTQSDQLNDNYFYANNCRFSHSYSQNVINGFGGNYFMVNCIASRGFRDGFNYHNNTRSKKPKAIEISCIGRNNGKETNGTANNGSTMHDEGSIIRVNCEHYENQGGNIADAYSSSVNLNCKAHGSRITDATRAGNFVAIHGSVTAKMWVYDCISYGSVYDLISDGGADPNVSAVIYNKNSQLLSGQNKIIDTGQIINITQ